MFDTENSLRSQKISVIGLGYVGLPIAAAFSKVTEVIGFDIDKNKINNYKNGIDVTGELGDEALKELNIQFTYDDSVLKTCNFHIITVPTPVDKSSNPDLSPLIAACKTVGKNLSKGSIIVFESTVYPGATEEICIPIIEKTATLKCGQDFKVGYSPERINPGDKKHTLENVVKIVSGIDNETLEIIAKTYGLIIKAGVYKASSIKVAEAAKIIENTQRDINIAFINEIALILKKLNIDTYEVLKAANTKWNFSTFYPGLVGGHCISVDPYYLIHKAEMHNCSTELITTARKINNSMSIYLADTIIEMLLKYNRQLNKSKILVLGVTFKENVNDTRNSGIIGTITALKENGITVLASDYLADKTTVFNEYGINLIDEASICNELDAVIIGAAHNRYKELDLEYLKTKYKLAPYIIVDYKKVLDRTKAENSGYTLWSL